METVASFSKPRQLRRERPARKRCPEREVHSCRTQCPNPTEHQPAGRDRHRLRPIGRQSRGDGVRVDELGHGERVLKEARGSSDDELAADSSDYQFPVRIEGKLVQVAASYDFGYVSVSMDAKDADPALFARVTKAVDAALATGTYDHYFVKPTS
jgi:hypothetical protein